MKRLLQNRRTFIFLLLTSTAYLWAPARFALADDAAHTPAVGSEERKALMDAMRAHGGDPDRVFVVLFLKVAGDWAWLDSAPQSRDGQNKYENESGLFRKQDGVWRIVDMPCGEGDCSYTDELSRIRAAFPEAPGSIFP